MVTASFSIHNLEFFLLILTRISTMISVAPFFNTKGVPGRTKIGLAFFLSILVATQMDYYDLAYQSTIGYTIMVAKEALTGLLIGVSGAIAMQTVAFAGHFIDIEIGFSMVQLFDPLTDQESSAFGSLYSYLIMLIMLASNMHYFIINSLIDSFDLIGLGQTVFRPDSIYDSIIEWAT
ncbi:MAG: flagellar biosynthetic protein FliR, partial [Lachnospiraceae bacterium]|nr:flagellar biosynthetic protein FliR [Lachnospiraceae bacterium]